jgi:MSHA biogenesis protein MshM
VALYLEHYGLNEPPFRITPHPDFFFHGADRGATLDGLLYAILHDEGIVKVSGEIGSGKTTLCRVLMERLPPEVETVFLANPSFSRSEILQAIAEELGCAVSGDNASPALRQLQSRLIELYGAGRRVVVMIDEAHAMPEETLEQVRLLSNLETTRQKLLQIVLFGQPELDETLDKPTMRQLKDRITHSFRTRPLTDAEVTKYIAFRMRVAGYKGPDIFTATAALSIARASSGLTRRINVLCDKALLAAFAANTHAVTPREVRAAIKDSEFAPVRTRPRRVHRWLAGAALVALGAAAGAGALIWLGRDEPAPPAPPPGPASAKTAPAPAAPGAAPASAPAPAPQAETTQTATAVVAPAPQNPARPHLSAEQLRRFNAYAGGPNPMLRERLVGTRETLIAEPDGRYSLELFVAENSDPARAERFLARARELVRLEDVYVIPMASGDRYRLRVTLGLFEGKEAARQAAQRLPPKYQKAFPLEPRSLAELRAAI